MREITLDFHHITLRYELHILLKYAFGFPDYYGQNLDALYDCLTDIFEDTCVTVIGADELRESLGRYGELTLRVLADAARDNEHLKLEIQPR